MVGINSSPPKVFGRVFCWIWGVVEVENGLFEIWE